MFVQRRRYFGVEVVERCLLLDAIWPVFVHVGLERPFGIPQAVHDVADFAYSRESFDWPGVGGLRVCWSGEHGCVVGGAHCAAVAAHVAVRWCVGEDDVE